MFNHHKPVIAITGATGFLGSHLMNSLLLKGYNLIILGRKNEESLEKRIFKLIEWFGDRQYPGQLEIVEIDFEKYNLGLSDNEFKRICLKTDKVIHCASDTRFSETKRKEVISFNVHQLKNFLDFVHSSNAKSFSYISTAYAAGLNGEICREKIPVTTEFINVYEESKAEAEKIIHTYCTRNSIPFSIIRPSIVYGDSQTGRTLKFNAFYYPIRSLKIIRDIYLNDIQNHSGKRSEKQGIFINKDGTLFLPFRFHLQKIGGINLIPVEYFTNISIKIIENPDCSGIFNLTNDVSEKLETLAEYTMLYLKIKGIEIIYNSRRTSPQNAAEELFDKFIEPYRPYLSDERTFDNINTKLIADNFSPPVMTEDIFRRCMDYAEKVNWGDSILVNNE